MNKIRKKIFLFSFLCIFVLTGLTACGEDGVKVNSANALARKLASDSAVKINVSKDIVLDEPIVVNGEKEIVGNGTVTISAEGMSDAYMITVADGGKLTVGGSVKIDAVGLMGSIHVQEGGAAIVQDKAVVKNASEATANAFVEGSFEVKGGTLEASLGHNIYNKKETVISGGEIIGSGDKFAGVYNEGTLTQNGGTISGAYNNVSNLSGSTFTFEGGTNTESIRDGIFVAEGATFKATKKEAQILEAGARGILLRGQADIKLITIKECGDSLIKVGKNGVLNLGNGILQEGNYHGVDNAGTMTMLGGTIQMNKNCGIVNTGTLKITSGNIANNENKGILNKHEGVADVTSAMVTFTSNKTAIANEDKAVFEFAKAKIMMSTQTNIYVYDGTMNIHDAALNASTSNNVRIIDGVINMTNVEVKGNSQSSGTSHHAVYMEGGVINAVDTTISMSTGHGIRNKGGVFKGKNIVMHDINRVAISQGKHDYLDVEGLTEIDGLEIQSTNYANIWNEGGGTVKITNGKLAVAGSNSIRVNDGLVELTNVTVPGHKEGSKDNIHGIYMEGGEIVAKNVTIKDTSGNALRNKNGKFTGTNIKMTNIKGQTAISNLPLDDDNKNGIINIDGLTIKNSLSKNITLDSGVTTIKNATLGATGGNNIKMQNNAATLNLYNVKIEGQHDEAVANTHGIMVEGGNVFGENIQMYNVEACGIRCKMGVVDLKNVTMTDIGQAAISNSKMVKDDVELGVGNVTIDGLTTSKVGTNNITMDAGKVTIKNGELCKIESKNHNVKTAGSGVVDLENVKIAGTTDAGRYGIIAEGGEAVLNNVEIYDLAKSGLHANRETSSIKGTNVTVKDAVYAITGSNGSITVDGFTTTEISANNILADSNLKVTIKNSTGEMGLCATPGHNAKATGDALVTLDNVEVKGVTDGSKHAIMAEGGDFALKDVVIKDVKNTGIRINRASSSVEGENVTIQNAGSAVTGTVGTITIDGLTTENITNNNIFAGTDAKDAEKSEDKCVITITNGDLCKTVSGHNVKSTLNGEVVLADAVVNGTEAGDKYGVIVEKGSTVELTDVTIQDVPSKAGIYSNNVDNKVTGTNVIVKNTPTAVMVRFGRVDIDGLTTENIKEKNILVEADEDSSDKAVVTVKNGQLCETGSHNVHIKDEDGHVTLEDVNIAGTTSNHGIMAEGGDAVLKNVTISNVANAGIRINKDTSTVEGENVTVTDSANGITGTKGEVSIDELTTSGIEGNNLLAESNCIMVITDGDLGQTGGHNVKATGSAIISLEDAKVKGTTSGSHHAIMAEGGDIALDNVEISGAKANASRAAIRIKESSSEVTGKDVTITDCSYGISGAAGTVEIKGLTSSAVKRNLDIWGGTYEITNATLNTTAQNNIHMEAGTLTLNGVSVEGTIGETVQEEQEDGTTKDVTYGCGIYVGGATLNVENQVTVKNTYLQGVHNNGGTIKGDKIVTQDTGNIALWNTAAGVITLDELVISGVKNGHGIKNEGENSAITVEKGNIGKSPSNNIYVSNGTVTLKNTTISGTVANHGVLAQGGDVVLENVVIENAAAAGIRANRGSSEVKAVDVIIKNCNEGISISDATVTLENVDVSNVNGHGIWTNHTVTIAGVIKAKMQLAAANEVIASKSLAGSTIVLDWDAGQIPADLIAIQFASAEDMQATKENGTITFGTNANAGYVPYFYGTQLLLNDRNNIQYTVKNFAELQEVMAEINTTEDINTATITVAGDITVTELITVETGKTVRIQDDTTARTIKRGASYTKGDLFEVKAGATLTFGSSSDDNSNPTLKIDGGSKNDTPVITESDSSLIRNNGTLTVASGVQLANAKGSEDYCKALAIFAAEGSTTSFSGVMKSIVGQHNGGYGIAITVGNTQDFIISDAVIKDNYTPGTGIIRLESGGKLTINNSKFENNESVTEAGVISDSGNANNRLTIEGSTFKNNKTSGSGGVLSLRCTTKDNVVISNTVFTSNTANAGAAINLYGGASITLADCEFSKNTTTNTAIADSNCGYGDIRLGDNRTGGIYISGKMVVDIYMNQAGKINVVGALADGSDVVANWRKGKISGDSFVGINFGTTDATAEANAAIAATSKEYITLSDNYNDTYVIKVFGATGTLIKPVKAEVKTTAEFKGALTTILNSTNKVGIIVLKDDITISEWTEFPTGCDITVVDDGTPKKFIRSADYKGYMLGVTSGATVTFASTSGDNKTPTLMVDGGNVACTSGNTLLENKGTLTVSQGVALQNNQTSGGNQGIALYSQAGSNTTFQGVIRNITSTYTGSSNPSSVAVKGTVVFKNAIVENNVTNKNGLIRLMSGSFSAYNTEFQNNEAGVDGGIINVDNNAANELIIDGCTFTDNEAKGSGGAIHIANKNDKQTIKNSKFTDNTASAGGAINMIGGAYLNLENCEFSGNTTTNTSTTDSTCGYGDIRLGDNRTGGITISGKMIVNIYMNQAGKINVVGELAEGSKVVANWRLTKITGDSFTGITFASAEMMEASKDYFELSANYSDTYDLTFSGTSGILEKK